MIKQAVVDRMNDLGFCQVEDATDTFELVGVYNVIVVDFEYWTAYVQNIATKKTINSGLFAGLNREYFLFRFIEELVEVYP